MDTYKTDDNYNDYKKKEDYDDILVDIDPNDMIPYGMQNINELMQMIREIIQEMALKPGEADNNALGFFESTRYWTHGTEAYAPDIDTDPRTKYLRFAQCDYFAAGAPERNIVPLRRISLANPRFAFELHHAIVKPCF